MNSLSYKTVSVNLKLEDKQWFVVDATGIPLGRLASQIATILRGKHKPSFSPFLDNGDYVIVVNATKVVLTGTKLNTKIYTHHTGYPGGQRNVLAKDMLERRPRKVIELAVKRMLPKNKIGDRQFTHLKVYETEVHGHANHNPVALDLNPFNKKKA